MGELENPLKGYWYVELSPHPDEFYQIVDYEAFEYETGDEPTAYFSEVASGSESGFVAIDILEPSSKPPRLYYVLWGVKDGCKYYLKLDTGTNRLGLDEDKDIGYITNEKSPYFDPNPAYAFWLIANWYPAINVKNETGGTVTPKIWFKGFKYDLVKVTDPEIIRLLRNFKKGLSPSIPVKRITIGGVIAK